MLLFLQGVIEEGSQISLDHFDFSARYGNELREVVDYMAGKLGFC
jgi:hypothetical protein